MEWKVCEGERGGEKASRLGFQQVDEPDLFLVFVDFDRVDF